MLKKAVVIMVVMVMVLFANYVQAGVSLVKNGSFENDGLINDIIEESPHHWCDVNIPSDKFGGYVYIDWSTHGSYSLTLYSQIFEPLTAGDTAKVSQQVYLENVNQIIFDVKLGTTIGSGWDPAKRSALVLVDGIIVWDSNDLGDGQYTVEVNNIDINDTNLHTLSLAMRINVSETEWFYEYLAQWDFVKFDTHCGGFGYLSEDLNHNCYVDMNDLRMLAEQWLAREPDYQYDLFQDDKRIVNFRDYSVLASSWRDFRDWKGWQDPDFVIFELPASDLNDDGIVDLRDFAILAGNWKVEGSCIRADIDRSEVVDYGDVYEMADEWLSRSWLYKLTIDN